MKIFLMAGSTRKDSLNKKLAAQAAEIVKAAGHAADHADFKSFPMPLYDGDLEDSEGVPVKAGELAERIASADAVILSVPEYNGSIPGNLKNAIDWVSRYEKTDAFDKKPVLLLGASPGALGAVAALLHSRQPLERLGAHVYPSTFGLPKADAAFDESGKFKDEKTSKRLASIVEEFLAFAGKLKA